MKTLILSIPKKTKTKLSFPRSPLGIVAFASRKRRPSDGTKQGTGIIHFSGESTENPLKTEYCLSKPNTKPEIRKLHNQNTMSKAKTPNASLFCLGFSALSQR
ncbi:MAG: hypothetical protein R2828_35680 [Saprospiraceae bacterium]